MSPGPEKWSVIVEIAHIIYMHRKTMSKQTQHKKWVIKSSGVVGKYILNWNKTLI